MSGSSFLVSGLNVKYDLGYDDRNPRLTCKPSDVPPELIPYVSQTGWVEMRITSDSEMHSVGGGQVFRYGDKKNAGKYYTASVVLNPWTSKNGKTTLFVDGMVLTPRVFEHVLRNELLRSVGYTEPTAPAED